MLGTSAASATFAVRDLAETKKFYGELLGLDVNEAYGGSILQIHVTGGTEVLIYAKDDHVPAGFTVLTFHVDDIRAIVRELTDRGVRFERPEGLELDELAILHAPGHDAAWFADPSGNVISLSQTLDS